MRFSAPKLIDCEQHGTGSELFIVEGDSAARTVERVRSEWNQAVLPMQGKPMNAIKVDLVGLCGNAQFAAVVTALGVDLTEPNINALRYEKYILLFDPDADGIHSRTLMLLFFYRWLRPLLDAGRVFDTHAPQWELQSTRLKETAYAFTSEHLEKMRRHLLAQGVDDLQTKRFRGLASVGAQTIFQLCVDPPTRKLTTLAVGDAEVALAMFEQMRELGRGLDADSNTP